MDVKEAVKVAKSYVSDLFAEERIENLGLEEVTRDNQRGTWGVTLGFTSTMLDRGGHASAGFQGLFSPKRIYKMVVIRDEDGVVESVKMREPVN